MRITIVHFGRLGELISALSLLSGLRAAHPQARITLVCKAAFVSHMARLTAGIADTTTESLEPHTHDLLIHADDALPAREGASRYERYSLLLEELGISPRIVSNDLQRICEERLALIHDQAREIEILRSTSEERLLTLHEMNRAIEAIREESERRGMMLTDMTMLAQEQESELQRLRSEYA